MSLKAGGVGLNLTAASHVFLMVHFHLCFSDDHFYFFFFFPNTRESSLHINNIVVFHM